jgi:hypothetical protein
MRCFTGILRVLGLCGFLTTFCLCSPVSEVHAQIAGRFERPDLGIAFWMPKGYQEMDPSPGITVLCLGPEDEKFTSRIHLQVKNARTSKLADNQAGQMIGQMEKLHPGYQSTSQGRFLLNKTVAVMLTGMYPAPPSQPALNGSFLNSCMVTTIRQGRVYTFVFTTTEDRFKKELPAFVRMIDTVRWIPARKTQL